MDTLHISSTETQTPQFGKKTEPRSLLFDEKQPKSTKQKIQIFNESLFDTSGSSYHSTRRSMSSHIDEPTYRKPPGSNETMNLFEDDVTNSLHKNFESTRSINPSTSRQCPNLSIFGDENQSDSTNVSDNHWYNPWDNTFVQMQIGQSSNRVETDMNKSFNERGKSFDIDGSQYTKLRLLGQGNFGKVFVCEESVNGILLY